MRIVFRHAAILAAGILAFSATASADSIPQIDPSKPHLLPVYPVKERSSGVTGTTVVAIHVNELGKPFDLQTESSSGSPALDKAAIEAVRHWRYLPATLYGESIADWTAAGFRFDAEGVSEVSVPPDTNVALEYRNKVICRVLPPVTGSHIDDKPVCMSRAQWQEQDRQKKAENFFRLMHNGAGKGGSGK